MKALEMKESYSQEMSRILHKYNEVDSRAKRLSAEIDDRNEENMLLRHQNDSLGN